MVKVLRSLVRGPLEPHAAGFAEELSWQGYSRSSAEKQVCLMAHLDRWMVAAGLGLDQLSPSVLQRYLAERRAAVTEAGLAGPLADLASPHLCCGAFA